MVQDVVAVPDLGDTRAELVAFVNGAVKVLGSTLMGRVMPGLVSDLGTDSELPIYYRLLLSGSSLDADLAEGIVDAVIPGLAADR